MEMASASISSPPSLPGTGLPDENKGPAILISCGILTILGIIAVAIRMLVRVKMIKAVGWDDLAILVALSLSVTGMAIIIPEVMNGAGRHIIYLPPKTVVTGLKLNWFTQPIYLWTACFVKVSVAFFLLRIAPSKPYKHFLKGAIAFLLLYNTFCFLTIVLQCRPLRSVWEGPSVPATCFSPPTLRAFSYTSQSLAIFTDLVFAILPSNMLKNVQINFRVKLAIIGIMSLGIFACIASVVKFHYLQNYGKTGDFLWDSQNLTIWSVVETNVGIIAASIPCMKPLFRRLLDLTSNYMSSNNNSRNANFGSSQHNSDFGLPLSNLKANKSFTSANRKNRTSAVGNYRQNRLPNGVTFRDEISQENILKPKTGIVKTIQVEVSRSSSERDDIVIMGARRPSSFGDQV